MAQISSPPSTAQNKNSPLGYPLIEKLVATEDFSKVNESVSGCYDILEKMLKNKSGGLTKQKKIRAALKAYDLTIDLIRELLKTKYELIRQRQQSSSGQTTSPQKK